ncbi:SGNH/GDSL hydrolase family protein [Butyrivibrio sp. JL13D10]|uniref:SGNH/GDSL hydrolase family protein n=1 Tax=Butyrivibrio sp. JL13D10 TaxID=3236815 RepID=UPI0038B4EA42
MKKESSDIKFIKRFAVAALISIVIIGLLVFLIDPFYHYHKPWFGLKAVLNDKEYQCIGTLRHFDYDTLIVGSSVAENNDNSWYDQAFNCKSIKAIRSYGATADLCYLLDEAFSSGNEIKRVFYNIDPSSLNASVETTYEMTGCPMYLYDHNPFNDVQYLYNKGVILEKIPYMLVNSYLTDYNENLSYNWAKWKNFSSESALGLYFRTQNITPMMDEKTYDEELAGNIRLLTSEVENHPDTQFTFFFPAYSMLWWDGIYRTGERDAFIHCEKEMVKNLLKYDNVKVFCFQNERDVITNLDNYMDSIHFSPEINKLMLDQMIEGKYQLTEDNYEDMLDEMKDFSDKIVNELIKTYEEQNLLNYEQIEE